MAAVLLTSVLLIAACGLIYELVAGALASYLLGDSVTQFSTVIGTYLCAMGVGSWLSRHIGRGLVARFVTVELLVALVGGCSSAVLFLAFVYTGAFRLVLYTLVAVIGVLVGLEIPLLMRILRDRFTFKDVVANVLTFDYLGALGASILFPILLVPHLGLVRSALLFGLVNAAVALWSTLLFRRQLGAPRLLVGACVIVLGLLAAGMAGANRITSLAEENLYADEVVLARSSRYQRIVLTAWKNDLRLFLNGHLQFSSRDEYRYHEALVHPGLAAVPGARRVLILGGGDGLAAREVLRYSEVESVTLVDLDPVMTQLFATHPLLTALNGGALTSPKLHIVNADAFVWLDAAGELYDFVIVDFPDPSSYNLGKLYTTAFYRLAAKHLSRAGLMVVQSTSPLFAPRSFWCIARTIADAGLRTYPYHVYVPSFGEWGFVLAGLRRYEAPPRLPGGLRYLTPTTLAELFDFPSDMRPVPVEPNHLNNQVLVRYYDQEWNEINR
ncbi:MAG: polyamine aminopropyltransferase [Gemmatimonadetes bacterium]|nr:MAG: polyamine aminopropyltransferase [Gemmatimonadota bacterium]PYP25645.1 MAG: polyamine aminopropyltransferase [Gemmatimonadota bacterium]